MSNTSLLGSYGAQDSSSLMFRNVLINGNFDVWQRGTSQTAAGYGSDDRWMNNQNGSTKTHSRQSFTPGQTDVPGNPLYFSRTVVSSVAGAGNHTLKSQRIESVTSLAGQTATLSFWAKADATKNMAVSFSQLFGTGGSPSAFVLNIGVNTIALTTSWKYYTVTFAFPSISGKTLGTNNDHCIQLNFWFEAGSDSNASTNSLGQQSGTFDIAQVQLEAGPVATPFERRPFGMELALCQRYFEKSYPVNVAPGTINTDGANVGTHMGLDATNTFGRTITFAVPKLKSPNITYYRTNAAGSQWLWYTATSSDYLTPVSTVTSTSGFAPRFAGGSMSTSRGAAIYSEGHWAADAEL